MTEHPPAAVECYRQAREATRDGDPDTAIRLYREALEYDPGFAEALINLGILYHRRGPTGRIEAQRCFRDAVALQPDSARAHYNLGVSLATDDDTRAEAVAAFARVVELSPDHRNAWYALAVHANRLGERDRAAEALAHYRAAVIGEAEPEQPVLRIRFVS